MWKLEKSTGSCVWDLNFWLGRHMMIPFALLDRYGLKGPWKYQERVPMSVRKFYCAPKLLIWCLLRPHFGRFYTKIILPFLWKNSCFWTIFGTFCTSNGSKNFSRARITMLWVWKMFFRHWWIRRIKNRGHTMRRTDFMNANVKKFKTDREKILSGVVL